MSIQEAIASLQSSLVFAIWPQDAPNPNAELGTEMDYVNPEDDFDVITIEEAREALWAIYNQRLQQAQPARPPPSKTNPLEGDWDIISRNGDVRHLRALELSEFIDLLDRFNKESADVLNA